MQFEEFNLASLVNALTGRNTLARVSNTPGRTREINLFDLGHRLILVDLPCYGFARVSKSQSAAWRQLIKGYLQGRPQLARVCQKLHDTFGIEHATLQVEGGDPAHPCRLAPAHTI